VKGQKDIQREEAQRVHEIMRTKLCPVMSGVAIDGGAHVGSWTVEMAKYFNVIHAFEPCWESFAMLCENIINSDIEAEVIPHNKALMHTETNVKMIKPRGRTTLTARQVKIHANGPVEAITIDALDLAGCDFIKLDLEGAEALALKGAKKTIKRFHPFLVIEFNNLARQFGGSESQIEKKLDKMGYELCWHRGVDKGYRWTGEA
jgi:FkbM family methyltransferase